MPLDRGIDALDVQGEVRFLWMHTAILVAPTTQFMSPVVDLQFHVLASSHANHEG